jgi:integrase
LREFHTSTGEQLLADIAHSNDLSRTMLKHIKSVLSGVFKHARRLGVLHTANPMQDTSIPKAREGAETRFYTLEEITRLLFVLPEPASTIAALAAFTGMRRGELAALVWENYEGVSVRVTQSVWGSHISKPKTRQSEAPVPVIAPLATKLESYRQTQGNPTSGLMFPSRKGTPLNLNNLLNRVIRPAFDRAGLEWKGWHAFRRGLATNLYQLGVPDKTIQTILRHSDVLTTLRHYVKTPSADAVQAMRSLEAICTSMHHSTEVELERVV